jgi:GDP/UDP-N,N'-diacetylbacillosamine 2-epimerase (hydrolysing)
MKRICVLTATRAEYGLLKPVILKLKMISEFDVRVVVTGAHLSPEFGLTYREIEMDGIEIDEKIEILLSADTPAAVSKSMGLALIGFADYFKQLEPDMLVVLGDRYETLAVAIAGMNQKIPIAHLYGGEATEGLVDEAIRHAITKLSFLHFTSTEIYRKRVIQLGESPARVFNVGSLGVENIRFNQLYSKRELEESLGWNFKKNYAVVTFHPVTLETSSAENQMKALLKAVEMNSGYQYLFTKANADAEGRILNQLIDEFVKKHDFCRAYTSLGIKRYLSAIKYASFVMGNSSSGIIEVPSFGVPTINIGDRQKGRIQAKSIINCEAEKESINEAIKIVMDSVFRKGLDKTNPYYKENTSERIIEEIKTVLEADQIILKKSFYDL